MGGGDSTQQGTASQGFNQGVNQAGDEMLMRPMRAFGSMMSGMVPRDVGGIESALTRMMGAGVDPQGFLGEVAKGAVGQYQNFKALRDEPALSQNWWNAAVPTGVGYAGMVAPFAGEMRAATGGARLPQAGESGSAINPFSGPTGVASSFRRGEDWGNVSALRQVTGANIRDALNQYDFGDFTHSDLAKSLGKIEGLPPPLSKMVDQYHTNPETYAPQLEGMARRYAAPVRDYPLDQY